MIIVVLLVHLCSWIHCYPPQCPPALCPWERGLLWCCGHCWSAHKRSTEDIFPVDCELRTYYFPLTDSSWRRFVWKVRLREPNPKAHGRRCKNSVVLTYILIVQKFCNAYFYYKIQIQKFCSFLQITWNYLMSQSKLSWKHYSIPFHSICASTKMLILIDNVI